MKTIFERLLKISNDYREKVDDLAQDWDLDGRRDYLYADEIKAQRVQERNSKFNKLIDEAAQEAAEKAEPEIAKLRECLKQYITGSSDLATLSTLQSLIAAGVQLNNTEINAFAQAGGYGVLKMLERPSGGHIQAPRVEGLKKDVDELTAYFRSIRAYRGEMADATSETFWGMSAPVGSTIQQGMIAGFGAKLDEIQRRWNALER